MIHPVDLIRPPESLDQKFEEFCFVALVSAFDCVWALSNALSSFQLAESDSAAIGGDLAYQYGKNGTVADIGLAAAQAVINDASFGSKTQVLHPLDGVQSGAVRFSQNPSFPRRRESRKPYKLDPRLRGNDGFSLP